MQNMINKSLLNRPRRPPPPPLPPRLLPQPLSPAELEIVEKRLRSVGPGEVRVSVPKELEGDPRVAALASRLGLASQAP